MMKLNHILWILIVILPLEVAAQQLIEFDFFSRKDPLPTYESANFSAPPVYTFTPDGKLRAFGESGGKYRLLTFNQNLELLQQKDLILGMKGKASITAISNSPDGGTFVAIYKARQGSAQAKSTLHWLDEKGELRISAETLGTNLVPEIIKLFTADNGRQLLLEQVGNGTSARMIRLRRDSMRKPVYIDSTDPVSINSRRKLSVFTREGGDTIAGIGEASGRLYFTRFTEKGAIGKEIRLEPEQGISLSNPTSLTYVAERSEYLLGCQCNAGVGNIFPCWQWFGTDGKSTGPDAKAQKRLASKLENGRLEHIVRRNDGSFLFTGIKKYGRSDKLWILELQRNETEFQLKMLNTMDGSIHFNHGFSLPEGGELLAGYNGQNDDPYFFRQSGSVGSRLSLAQTNFGEPELYDQQGDNVLDAGEAACLEIPFSLPSVPFPAHLKASFRLGRSVPGLPSVMEATVVVPPKGGKGQLWVPLNAEKGLPTGSFPGTVTITGGGVNSVVLNYTLKTRALPQPNVIIDTTIWVGLENSFARLDTHNISVKLRNIGPGVAYDLSMSTLPFPDVCVSADPGKIDSLLPDEEIILSYKVFIQSYCLDTAVAISFFVRVGSQKKYSHGTLPITLPDALLITRPDGSSYIPESLRNYRKRKGGPSGEQSFVPIPPSITLSIPSRSEDFTIKSQLKIAPLRASIEWPDDLTTDDIDIYRLGKNGEPDTPIRTTYLGLERIGKSSNGEGYVFDLFAEMAIEESLGDRKKISCRIEVKGQSASFHVENQQLFRKLYVVSIGVPYGNGEPTVRAATRFNEIYSKMSARSGGRFFDEVDLELITDSESTSIAGIHTVFNEVYRKVKADAADRLTISYVIVFISGHGKNEQGNFNLKTSSMGIDGSLVQLNALNILRLIKNLPAQKTIIFDACNSNTFVKEENLASLGNPMGLKSSFSLRIMSASNREAFYQPDSLSVFFKSIDFALSQVDSLATNDFSAGILTFDEFCETVKRKNYELLKGIIERTTESHLPAFLNSLNAKHPTFKNNIFEQSIKITAPLSKKIPSQD